MNVKRILHPVQNIIIPIVSIFDLDLNVDVILVMHRSVRKGFFFWTTDELIVDSSDFMIGSIDRIYAALQLGETCLVYDQCAANQINCGGGKCLNSASINGSQASCYCESNLTLIQLSAGNFDCVCPSDTSIFVNGLCVNRTANGRREVF